MVFDLNQQHPTCRLSNHGVRWHPVALLTPTCFHIPDEKTRLARPGLNVWEKKTEKYEKKFSASSKVPDLHGMRSYMKFPRFQVGTTSSPYSRNTWFQTFLAKRKTIKTKKHQLRRQKLQIHFASWIQRFCGMRYPFWSAIISEYVWWLRWHFRSAYLARKAKWDRLKFNSQS